MNDDLRKMSDFINDYMNWLNQNIETGFSDFDYTQVGLQNSRKVALLAKAAFIEFALDHGINIGESK